VNFYAGENGKIRRYEGGHGTIRKFNLPHRIKIGKSPEKISENFAPVRQQQNKGKSFCFPLLRLPTPPPTFYPLSHPPWKTPFHLPRDMIVVVASATAVGFNYGKSFCFI